MHFQRLSYDLPSLCLIASGEERGGEWVGGGTFLMEARSVHQIFIRRNVDWLRRRSTNVIRYASVSVLLSRRIFSPGLNAGIPMYGQLAQRKASPR